MWASRTWTRATRARHVQFATPTLVPSVPRTGGIQDRHFYLLERRLWEHARDNGLWAIPVPSAFLDQRPATYHHLGTLRDAWLQGRTRDHMALELDLGLAHCLGRYHVRDSMITHATSLPLSQPTILHLRGNYVGYGQRQQFGMQRAFTMGLVQRVWHWTEDWAAPPELTSPRDTYIHMLSPVYRLVHVGSHNIELASLASAIEKKHDAIQLFSGIGLRQAWEQLAQDSRHEHVALELKLPENTRVSWHQRIAPCSSAFASLWLRWQPPLVCINLRRRRNAAAAAPLTPCLYGTHGRIEPKWISRVLNYNQFRLSSS